MAFEAILSQQRAAPSGWRRIIMTFSVLLHAIALAAGVAHSVWQVEEMAMPAIEVTLSMAPPPPPPPPPPPKRKSSKPKTKPVEVKPKAIVAPTETAKEQPEEAAEEESAEDEEGEDEGEEGGVVGGVVGGIVGGTAPPPPPTSTGPKQLSTKAGHSLLMINPQRRPYKVNVPEEYVSRGDEYVTQLRICVSPQGTVSSVKILRPSIPVIDLQIPTVVPRWKYKPYIVDGRPTAFCYPMNYRVR